MPKLPRVTMYTDGACLGNPGAGGYGVVILEGKERRELKQGYRLTTNNRMEILAAIAGLAALERPSSVSLYTDSHYVADSIMLGWAERWRANGWKKNRSEMALNSDLWAKLLELCARHRVVFHWVKGHAGNAENERCDRLSVEAALSPERVVDAGYEVKRKS